MKLIHNPDRVSSSARAVIIASARGRIRYISHQGEQFLRIYFGSAADEGTLPRALQEWLKTAVLGLTMILDGEGARLSIRLVEPKSKKGICILFNQTTVAPATDAGTVAAGHALTTREMEVLEWVAEGKSNEVIGKILGTCTATVRKHLQNIFVKLEVDNRTSAARSYREMQTAKPIRLGREEKLRASTRAP